MNFILFLLFFIFVYDISCFKEGIFFPKKENIIILTDYTFEEAFNEYEYLLTLEFQIIFLLDNLKFYRVNFYIFRILP